MQRGVRNDVCTYSRRLLRLARKFTQSWGVRLSFTDRNSDSIHTLRGFEKKDIRKSLSVYSSIILQHSDEICRVSVPVPCSGCGAGGQGPGARRSPCGCSAPSARSRNPNFADPGPARGEGRSNLVGWAPRSSYPTPL